MIPHLALPSGDSLPQVGLGLWKVARDEAPRVVADAIQLGYRHLDSACDYGNEAEVGEGIRMSLAGGDCSREDLWITSKLWNTYHAAEHVRAAAVRSLHDLGVDYLDSYLIHFPIALKYVSPEQRYPPGWIYDPEADQPAMEPVAVPIQETWQAIEALVREGLVRNIGICNVTTGLLRDVLSYATIRPTVLQVESHPFLTQEKLLRMCGEEDIALTAFSPFGSLSYVSLGMASEQDSILAQAAVQEIAGRVGKSPAQVVLRWGVQRGTAVIPKSKRRDHLAENLALFDFELGDEEMKLLSGLNRNRRFNDPGVFCEQAFNKFFPIFD